MRTVVDFIRVNEVTAPDRSPKPLLKDFLHLPGGENIVFTAVDLKNEFLPNIRERQIQGLHRNQHLKEQYMYGCLCFPPHDE